MKKRKVRDDLRLARRDATITSWIVSIAAFAALGTTAGLYIGKFWGPFSTDSQLWAQFGDYFGGVLGSIFGFLSLIAILTTVRMQSVELGEARAEAAKQGFESMFFQLLNLHLSVLESIDLRRSGAVSAKGRDCFLQFHQRLQNRFNKSSAANEYKNDYLHFFQDHAQDLTQYFSVLTTLLTFVHEAKIVDKNRYMDIVRAQFSPLEVRLLFFDVLCRPGRHKTKLIFEAYGLLRAAPRDNVADLMCDLYAPSAFGDGGYSHLTQ